MHVVNDHIPVVMFHSLKYTVEDSFYLSFRTDYFVEAIRQLLGEGFKFITIEDIVCNRYNSGEKLVCFSSDDGFADNYAVLFPIIKYFGIRVSIFLSGEFIAKDEVHAPIDPNSPWLRPFLSVSEICEMHESGLVDFQGHSMTHTWYPTSGKVVAIHPIDKLDKYYWLYWNKFPERKPVATRQEMLELKCKTFAVFEHSRALDCRRFLPDRDEFSCQGLRVGDVVPGRWETEGEQVQRYEYELIHGKKLIERMLSKNVCFLCWPGGAMDHLSYQVFCRAGYDACSVPSSALKRESAEDIFEERQKVIQRFGPGCSWRGYNMGPGGLVRKVLQSHRFSWRRWAVEKGLRGFQLLRGRAAQWVGGRGFQCCETCSHR